MHREVFVLGDAGVVSVDIGDRGARMASIDSSPGWGTWGQAPRRWARRRPAPAVAVWLLRRGGPDQWKVEVNRPPDGSWEASVFEQRPGSRPAAVTAPGGTTRLRWGDASLYVDAVEPAAGWAGRTDPDEDDAGNDVTVSFSRGGEEWEVVVLRASMTDGRAFVQRTHRWTLDLGASVDVAP